MTATLAESASPASSTSAPRTVQAACPHDCPDTCAMRVTVQDDQVIRLQGDGIEARFFNRISASQLDRTLCSNAGGDALAATYGAKVGMHVEHYAESRLIVIWGSNSIASNLHFWPMALAARRAGATLVC